MKKCKFGIPVTLFVISLKMFSGGVFFVFLNLISSITFNNWAWKVVTAIYRASNIEIDINTVWDVEIVNRCLFLIDFPFFFLSGVGMVFICHRKMFF